MKQSKFLSVVLTILTALAVLAGSVAVPLLCRPFYYAHIDSMNLTEYTGMTREQIVQAYDEMMDYCLGRRPDFSVGILSFSQSGASHFADVRGLFLADLWILGLSVAGLAVLFVYCRRRKRKPYCFLGRGPGFWSASVLGIGFLIVAGLAALDFDRAFEVFHSLFFPGKENWIFDWQVDPVILILPQEFFRNCAILILALLLVWCAVLIVSDLTAARIRKKRQQNPEMTDGCAGCTGCQR